MARSAERPRSSQAPRARSAQHRQRLPSGGASPDPVRESRRPELRPRSYARGERRATRFRQERTGRSVEDGLLVSPTGPGRQRTRVGVSGLGSALGALEEGGGFCEEQLQVFVRGHEEGSRLVSHAPLLLLCIATPEPPDLPKPPDQAVPTLERLGRHNGRGPRSRAPFLRFRETGPVPWDRVSCPPHQVVLRS